MLTSKYQIVLIGLCNVYKTIYTFGGNLGSNSSFKSRFQEAFLVKVINTKKIHYMY